MVRCKDCIHYNICCLWSTTDLDENESYKYCFGNYKDTADVAPRAEVAREIFKEIDSMVELAEIEWGTIFGVKMAIAELKKKYTEGEK